METAFVSNSKEPILNGLEDVIAYEEEKAYQERFPLQTSYDLLSTVADRYPDDYALRCLVTAEENEAPIDLTFKQLFEKTTQTANALHSLGVGSKDTVSVMLTNMAESHLAIWGAQAAGISSPLNPLLESKHLVEIMNTTVTKVFITMAPVKNDSAHWAKVEEVIEQIPTLETLLIVTVPGYTEEKFSFEKKGLKVLDFNEVINTQPKDKLLNNRTITAEETASYFHTGGTTGRPKIAQVTHGNVAFVAQVIEEIVRYKGRLVGMSALPLFHIYGLISAGIATLFAGRTIVVMSPDGFRNLNVLKNWWHHAARFKVSAFGAVPTILTALMQIPVGDNDISLLDDVGSGAAPLPKQLRKDFEEKFNVRVTNGYGMTETCCIISRQRSEVPGPEGSVGTRFPYTGARTVVLDGNKVIRECESNESGVLLVRGPHVFKGYLDKSDNDKAWVDGDWFNTGDVAFIDENGFITLTGRAKDLIIRGGHNIDPVIIEEPISKHPAVAQVVAIGQPDAYAGELPVVYIQLKPGFENKVTTDDFLEYCQEKITERAAIPKRVEFIDQMPVTAVGKFFKPELRNRSIYYVLTEAMKENNINGDVDSYFEQARGHVAAIKLHNKDQLDSAREVLERFPVVIEFV
ncbi:MAG: acyl-CoA synthetase [Cellvibrionaceae bacterium]